MPRTGTNTKEKIISAAKEELMQDPGKPVSMRQIAARCNISAGTIYNYFPDKDSLMAAVMIQDWHKAMSLMEKSSQKAQSFTEGAEGIYEALCRFIDTYRNVWMNYSVAGNYAVMHEGRHKELADEITVYVRSLLERFAQEKDLGMDRILAENILAAAMQEDIGKSDLIRLFSYIAD